MRFDFAIEPLYVVRASKLLPFLVLSKVVIFFCYGLYRSMWRYTNVNDLWRLSQAALVSSLFFIAFTLYVFNLERIPVSIFLIDGLLTFIMCGGLRLGIRFYHLATRTSFSRWLFSLSDTDNCPPEKKSLLIIGAGGAGEKMYREIMDNPRLNSRVVGFLDDDRSKWGRSLHCVKIFGGVKMLPKVMEMERIDEVLIATPSATGPQMRCIIDICKKCGARFRTLPEIGAIIDGKISIKNLRDVRYEDLLRRPPVKLVTTEISQYLKGKRVFVTGAGGSIGSELCRQIIRFDPQELILVDASEANLYSIQMELQHELDFDRYRCLLAKVQTRPLMEAFFKQYRPQVIYHAAAYKHVPLLENNPWEAIYNNVIGSQVIMSLALQYRAERFVLVSTDKAVRPTNVMGASKRLAELILQSWQGNGTRFMAVRFGNVIGSSGSVLPLFRRQLENGGPITVTHPKVTRYFMTIPEAAQLILQAGSLGEGGEIFILEMGTPVNIADMAEELVRLSGKEPGKDVEIVFTGLREGEKLFEELITQGEGIVGTRHANIMVLRSSGWNGSENQNDFKQWMNGVLEDLTQVANTHDAYAIKSKLQEILPEYIMQQSSRCVLEPKPSRGKGRMPSMKIV